MHRHGHGIRRALTQRKIKQRDQLLKQAGVAGGRIYARHINKVHTSTGYLRTGNLTHYMRSRQHIKTRDPNRYGTIFRFSHRDQIRWYAGWEDL